MIEQETENKVLPVWVRRCLLNKDGLSNALPQYSQGNMVRSFAFLIILAVWLCEARVTLGLWLSVMEDDPFSLRRGRVSDFFPFVDFSSPLKLISWLSIIDLFLLEMLLTLDGESDADGEATEEADERDDDLDKSNVKLLGSDVRDSFSGLVEDDKDEKDRDDEEDAGDLTSDMERSNGLSVHMYQRKKWVN